MKSHDTGQTLGFDCVIDPGLLGRTPIIEKTGFAKASEALFRRWPSVEREEHYSDMPP